MAYVPLVSPTDSLPAYDSFEPPVYIAGNGLTSEPVLSHYLDKKKPISFTYYLQPFDDLTSLCTRFNTTLESLLELNPMLSLSDLEQRLLSLGKIQCPSQVHQHFSSAHWIVCEQQYAFFLFTKHVRKSDRVELDEVKQVLQESSWQVEQALTLWYQKQAMQQQKQKRSRQRWYVSITKLLKICKKRLFYSR